MVVLFAAALMAAAPMWKDEQPCGANLVYASDPGTLVKAMQAAGYQAKLSKDKVGDPMIDSSAAGYSFTVYFYGCDKGTNCDSVQFHSSFTNEAGRDATFANQWNASKRFLQMSIRDDKSIDVRYDVTTLGGLNQKNFADVIDWWAVMLGELGQFFDTHPAPAAKAES